MSNEQSNEDWFVEQIEKAMSVDRLTYLAELIEHDKAEPVTDYINDPAAMERIRKAWGDKKKELSR